MKIHVACIFIYWIINKSPIITTLIKLVPVRYYYYVINYYARET